MFKELDQNSLHIILPKSRVSWDMLIWSSFMLLFFLLAEMIIFTGNAPRPVMIMPVPLLLFAILFFNQWYKWFTFGQLVQFKGDHLVIKERFLDLFSRKRQIPINEIQGFTVTPFVEYRSASTPATGSATTKGYCVKVLFHTKRLFWFIEKDKPHITIGAYLKRKEAEELKSWLDFNLNKRTSCYKKFPKDISSN